LGYTSRDQEPPLFRTDGSELLLSADGFSHGGVLDPEVGITEVYVGNPNRLPVYNQKTGVVSNVTHSFHIIESQVVSQTLPAGQYWLVSSNGNRVFVRSCLPGGVTRILADRVKRSRPGQTPSTSPGGADTAAVPAVRARP
jgi:hypothetical protein